MNKIPLCVGNAATVRIGGGGNTGNLVHALAARRILGDYHEKNGFRPWTDEEVEWIDAHCSHIVYVAANALRIGTAGGDHEDRLKCLAQNINRTSLPTVVFGLGGQAASSFKGEPTLPIKAMELLYALSERSVSIAVRGAFTAETLNYFGVKNVTITGCQSALYWLQPQFSVTRLTKPKADTARVAFNYTSMLREPELIRRAIEANWFGIGQQHGYELALKENPAADPGASIQGAINRKDLDKDAFLNWLSQSFEQFHDLDQWLDFLSANIDFSFGSRFHGNMAALLAGVRALWVSHDMRTQELVDHMKLPSASLDQVKTAPLQELIGMADYTAFESRYPYLYKTLSEYLTNAGLTHQLSK